MKQRGMTVLVGAILTVALAVLVGRAPVPYVSLEPGVTFDTLGTDGQHEIIVIDGAPTSSSTGQLRFLTVGVVSRLTLIEAVVGWIKDDEAVVPRELVYPPDQSDEEVQQHNAQDFADSISAAQTAALKYLDLPLAVAISEVSTDSPNASLLKAGDIITAVDGTPTADPDAVLSAIRAKPVGSTLTFAISRDGAPIEVTVTTVAGDDGVPRVGFRTRVRPANFTIDIPIEGIGGPSAGLMMALGIIDKLTPEDLTGGRVIAGTGTIDANGTVGPIGGVPQKILAANGAKATVMLVPAGNCAEAVANNGPGLELVRVETLQMAVDALATLRSGGTPTLC